MRGIIKGLGIVIPFWTAVVVFLIVKGWMWHLIYIIGALSVFLIGVTIALLAIEWIRNARKNKQTIHLPSCRRSWDPEFRSDVGCRCNE